MKNATALVALFVLVSLNAQAQRTVTWKGGAPGKKSDWNCPTNWKEGRVPDEFSNVVIPNVSTSTFSYPVLHKGTVEIFSLECGPNARLTVQGNARIIVLDAQRDKPQDPNKGLVRAEARPDSAHTPRQ